MSHLTDEQREELSGCAECMAALCAVCGHEPCPVCVDDCDDAECILWSHGKGTKKHVCVFARCAKHTAFEIVEASPGMPAELQTELLEALERADKGEH